MRGRPLWGRGTRRRLVVTTVACWTLLLSSGLAVAGWTVGLRSGSTGEAQSSSPAAPANVASKCASSSTVTVTWDAVPHAASYTVYESSTSASSGYAQAATEITATTWTSGTLKKSKSYWFELTATVGSHWVSADSSDTGPRVLGTNSCS